MVIRILYIQEFTITFDTKFKSYGAKNIHQSKLVLQGAMFINTKSADYNSCAGTSKFPIYF